MNQVRIRSPQAGLVRFNTITAGLAAMIYVLFALLAWIQFPAPYSPARNWLSDLGDANQNPSGALYYNLGITLTALLVLAFFLSISSWKMKGRAVQNWMVGFTQWFGVLGSLAMLMSAVFPINLPSLHRVWSIALYMLLGTAFAFSVAALRYQTRFPRWVLAVGLVTALVDIFSGVWHEVTLLEWITVALFLTYMLLLGWTNRQLLVEV